MGNQFPNERIGECAAGCDGIEGFLERWEPVTLYESTGAELIANDYLRNQRDGLCMHDQNAEHGHVVHFRGDDGADAGLIEDEIEGCANVALKAWKEES